MIFYLSRCGGELDFCIIDFRRKKGRCWISVFAFLKDLGYDMRSFLNVRFGPFCHVVLFVKNFEPWV